MSRETGAVRGTALVVIDMQVGVLRGALNVDTVLANVAALVVAARRQRLPIVWIQHEDVDLPREGANWQLADGLTPLATEPIIAKSYRDGFEETCLGSLLEKLAAGHLIVVGAQSEFCVRTTAHRALIEGFDVTLVADAHTTTESGGAISAPQAVAHTNDYFRGLRYPARTATVAAASEVMVSMRPEPAGQAMCSQSRRH